MKLYIFSIRDTATNIFNAPFYSRAPGAAIRDFAHTVNTKDTAANSNPGDFELYMLGLYNDEDGTFDLQKPEMIKRGLDCKTNTNGE